MSTFARMNGTPYAGGMPTSKQIHAEVRRAQQQNPDLRVAKTLVTTASRQEAATVKSLTSFLDGASAAMEESPALRHAYQNIACYDEAATNVHGDHAVGQKGVYDAAVRKAGGGAARSAAPDSGSSRMTCCVTITAKGYVPPVGTYVKGTYLQPRWFAPPYPPGVSETDVKNLVCIPTPCGVATKDAHLKMFEQQCLAPLHAQRYHDATVPLIIILDACTQHGVENFWGDMDKSIAKLLKKYNARLVVVPSNCSTHASPLDLLFLGNFKNILNATLQKIVSCRHMREMALHPVDLVLEDVRAAFPKLDLDDDDSYPTAFQRALHCEPTLSPRTIHMVTLLIMSAKQRQIANAAAGSFANHGIWPINRGLFQLL